MKPLSGEHFSPGVGSSDLPSAVDVLVVGFGPVGALTAILLARAGIRVLVVDKASEILTAPRAIALDNEALRILQMADVGEGDFDTVAIPYIRMLCPLVGEFARMNTAGGLDGHPRQVTFYQPDLERCLRDRLARQATASVALGVSLAGFQEEASGVLAALRRGDGETQLVRARYLIGADGASSLVRELIGQAFDGKTFAEDWLIVDARNVAAPIDHIEFNCDHRRPNPHMTAPGGRERWEFMLRAGESRDDMESDARIGTLLKPWGALDTMMIERRAVYRFHARVAKAFRSGRTFLVGDAAHITPPFVGQGLVAGLRDAANLSWKMAWVIHGRAASRILATYDQERRPHARAMINLAKLMGRLVMPRDIVTAVVIHGLMRLTRHFPPLRAAIEDLGIKPKPQFRKGLFVRGRSPAKLRRGGLLPQGWVRDAECAIYLSDTVLGPGLTLIGFGRSVADGLDAHTARRFAACGGAIVHIAHRGHSLRLATPGAVEDLEGVFLPRTVPFGWAAIVRPDRTVLHDGPGVDADRLICETLDLLGAPDQSGPEPESPTVAVAPPADTAREVSACLKS